MKKLLLLFVATLTLASCDTNDDNINYYYDAVPTVSADVPPTMETDKAYTITIDYKKPTNCYTFATTNIEGRIIETEDPDNPDAEPTETRIITMAVINRVDIKTDGECEELAEIAQTPVNFETLESGSYIFRFWAGVDENEEDIFLEYPAQIL
ncbi:hypothetical protein BN863_34560 [Formosa agariphila KMM 3901]|uniref:Lipoprotein n=1 Tax=Formosa agariphila (strain DSM 15362 / KCTC 12365 / LMG 23005 / KMM 3901 / M-2Alg 35-1) TaxID=1347342 RepID=T2KRM4_FORAG|nr:membrane lipoprotein lipid attachment site-containing protein [Formosa agariphila]CDF81168.1 hypothetical protein BN863_34560 [Formosa agariphila KMM 3901]